MKVSDYNFTLSGNNPDQVLRKMQERKSLLAKNSPDKTNDKLTLIIEGGAMRTIVSGGFLVALHELGFCDIFDTIYGTSAGALGGAYFLSKQTPYGISLFYEVVNNSDFINLMTVPPYFNIDYLMDAVINKKKLDVQALKNHPTELFIPATSVITGKARYFSSHEDIDILAALKASCALPIYYDNPVQINGGEYLDGGIVSALPVPRAILNGSTHILVLMTDSPQRKVRTSYLPFWFELWRLKKYNQKFIYSYFNRAKNFQTTLKVIQGEHEKSQNVHIAAIAPEATDLHAFTIDKKKLKTAYQASYQYCRQTFDERA